jgi:hypothetical protein
MCNWVKKPAYNKKLHNMVESSFSKENVKELVFQNNNTNRRNTSKCKTYVRDLNENLKNIKKSKIMEKLNY